MSANVTQMRRKGRVGLTNRDETRDGLRAEDFVWQKTLYAADVFYQSVFVSSFFQSTPIQKMDPLPFAGNEDSQRFISTDDLKA
jgi:hypothetical protein